MNPIVYLVEPEIYRITNKLHISLQRRLGMGYDVKTLCNRTIKIGYIIRGNTSFFKGREMCAICHKRAVK